MPVVDTSTSKQPERLSTDLAECRQLAIRASGWTPPATVIGGALASGAIGAAAGAAIGAALGDPGTGAAIGAAAGGISGGAQTGLTSQERFKSAFRTCLRNRGHAVVN
jgi:uncharacterized protein YcfJ